METFSLTCKGCGAPLTVDRLATFALCEYCGARMGIRSSTAKDPDVVILEPAERKPPVQAEPVRDRPRSSADDRRRREEQDQVRLVRHGANLLDAVFGFRSCLSTAILLIIVGGFLMCGLCGLPGFLRNVDWDVNSVSRSVKAQPDRTDRMLDDIERRMDSHARAHRVLPTADEGNEITAHYEDEWGRPIRYEQNSASSYVLRSAGPDGEFGTRDDITESGSASVADSSREAAAPRDLAAALKQLRTPGLYQKHAAIKWLLQEEPALDGEQRAQVVEAAIELLQDRRYKPQAQTALNKWANSDDVPKLVKAAEQTYPHLEEYIDALVVQLIRLKDQDAVLSFLNHPSTSVRASVSVAVNDWGIADDVIVQQCLADIDHEQRQAAALERLKTMQLDSSRQEEVNGKAKTLLLSKPSVAAGVLAIDLLERSGQIDVQLLMKVYEENASVFVRDIALRDRVGSMLIKNPEPSVCLLFAKQLANRHDESAAAAAVYLKQIGPVAESFVWPTLLGDNREAQERACEVLRAIGTEKSIPYLERLSDDESLGSQAKAAILDIQTAGRMPVEAEAAE